MSKLFLLFFFFFKQKTAYEMRISDWSSDVCSSDLVLARPSPSCRAAMPRRSRPNGSRPTRARNLLRRTFTGRRRSSTRRCRRAWTMSGRKPKPPLLRPKRSARENGRESCRERGGRNGESLVVGGAYKKNK